MSKILINSGAFWHVFEVLSSTAPPKILRQKSMSRRVHRQNTAPVEPPSPTILRPAHLPSDTWPVEHPEYSPEIHQLASSIKYLALRNKCTHLRHGTRCIISPKYYVGTNNLVREVVFQDSIVWIALFARLDSVGEFA